MAKKKTADTPASPRTPRKRTPATVAPKTGNGNGRADPTHSEIAEAAYHRYLNRHGAGGSDFDDWLEAERELRARSSPKSQ